MRFALVERERRGRQPAERRHLELVLASGERLRIGTGVDAATLRTVLEASARMIHLPASVRVYVCLTPCDMRKSFDGLHALVREHLELDAFAGHLFVFASRRKDRVKILYWDRDGFAVWSKRLEEGTYAMPLRRRRGEPAGDHGAGIRGAAERNRPDTSHAPQALWTVRVKHRRCMSCLFLSAQ